MRVKLPQALPGLRVAGEQQVGQLRCWGIATGFAQYAKAKPVIEPEDLFLLRFKFGKELPGAEVLDPRHHVVEQDDAAALGAYEAAEAFGLSIGGDLSVISYDGIPEGAWVRPPLTTFSVDSRNAGARLAELLIRRVRGEAPEALRETALATLQVGGSDGPPACSSEDIARKVEDARAGMAN